MLHQFRTNVSSKGDESCLKALLYVAGGDFEFVNKLKICKRKFWKVSLLDLKITACRGGFSAKVFQLNEDTFQKMIEPYMLYWWQNRYVLVEEKIGSEYRIFDPLRGYITIDVDTLKMFIGKKAFALWCRKEGV